MKSFPTKCKSFQRKIVQMGALQKLQNSIQTAFQTLIILWPVYPIHTNFLFWVIFEELPFCYSWLRLSNLVDLSFEYLSFSNKWKTTILLINEWWWNCSSVNISENNVTRAWNLEKIWVPVGRSWVQILPGLRFFVGPALVLHYF